MDIKAAGILIFNKEGELLVLHRKAHVPEGNRWGLPGGKVADGITFLDTATLKTQQESGIELNPGNLTHLATFKFIAEGNNVKYEAWVAETTLDPNYKVNLNFEGHDSYKWEKPEILLKQTDLMVGMYPILEKFLQLNM